MLRAMDTTCFQPPGTPKESSQAISGTLLFLLPEKVDVTLMSVGLTLSNTVVTSRTLRAGRLAQLANDKSLGHFA